MHKRLISFILAGTMAILVSCASDAKSPTDKEQTTESGNPSETTAPAEKSGVPSDLDLGGETINIWYTTKASSVAQTFVDIAGEMTGEILDDAIFSANKKVEEKLNCVLNYYNSQVPTSDTGKEVQKLLLSDDTSYDLFHVIQWNASKLAAEGLYLNIKGAPYLSLDKPWWDGGYMKEMTIGENALYALVGDYAVDRTRCLNCVYYNKDMYNDFYKNPNGIYDEVLAGTWTLERLRKISADVWSDINNNGISDRADRLGYCVNDGNNLDGFFYGSGARVTERDKDGNPLLIVKNELVSNVCDQIYKICFETDGGYMSGIIFKTVGSIVAADVYEENAKDRRKFEEGTSMFLFGYFYTSEAMRDMKSDFGIVPYPKFDEKQTGYISGVHNIMRFMVLPANCQKVEAVCAVLEELSFTGYNDVLPAYYDVLMKHKYARDDVSATMIDLIRDNCVTDIAYVYNEAFNSLGYIYQKLIQKNSNNFASEYASRESAAKTNMAAFIEQFMSVGQ